MIHGLELDYATTQFYEYSKEAKDGFEEHTSSTGKKSFRKFYKEGVFGNLESLSLTEGYNNSQLLSVCLKDGNELYFVKLPLYNLKGDFDFNFVEPLICTLPNMVKGNPYRLFPFKYEAHNGKTYKGLSIKDANLQDKTYADESLERKYKKAKKDEEVTKDHLPKIEFETVFGKLAPTIESKAILKKFLVKVLEAELERLKFIKPETSEEPVKEKPKAAMAQPPAEKPKAQPVSTVVEDEDDLPF